MARVYISSTYSDLISYREAVYRTLRKLDCDVITMEDYVAADQRPLDRCLRDVNSCDLYIGIFAWCYGYIPEHENPEHKSITELEYDQARKDNKPKLLFLLNEEVRWIPRLTDSHTDAGNNGQFIKRLRQQLERENIVSFFETEENLAQLVSVAVSQWKEQHRKIHSPAMQLNPKKHPTRQPFDRHPCFDASFDEGDLNLKRIDEFLQRDLVKRDLVEHQIDMQPVKDQLAHFGLMNGIHPTYAMVLCFSEKPQTWLAGASTNCYIWRDNTGNGGSEEYKEFRGNLLTQLDSCMKILRNNLHFSRVITREGSDEQCEIPLRALEEAITNALKHREYATRENEEQYISNPSSVQIHIFKNRIEIQSPGSLPPPLTSNTLRSANVSQPINPVIAHVFHLYQRGERAGKGIQRMDFLMSEAGLPLPRYEEINGQFKVILERPQQIPEEIRESSEFSHQLQLGLEGIAASKNITSEEVIIQIQNVTATTNSSVIEKWRRGRVPPADIVARLADLCVETGKMDQIWLQAFLRAANFSDPTIEAFTAKLFPLGESQEALKSIIVNTLRTELPVSAYYDHVTYYGHKDHVYDVAWSPDSQYIASASADCTVHVWEAITGNLVLIYQNHSKRVNSVAWSPDGKYIASASNDKTVQIWNATTGIILSSYSGHSDWVNDVAWSPDGQYIASASNDKSVQVWSAARNQKVFIHHGHSHWVRAVVWSPDGTSIASASRDKTVQIWSVDQKDRLLIYHGHTGGVNALLWSPRGTVIASGSNDKSVQLWESSTGTLDTIYRQHTNPILSLARSPHGRRIISASGKSIYVWYADTGKDIITDQHHTGWVRAVAWSPDGMYVATGSEDKTVYIRRLFDNQTTIEGSENH